jgi:hypothetical protein
MYFCINASWKDIPNHGVPAIVHLNPSTHHSVKSVGEFKKSSLCGKNRAFLVLYLWSFFVQQFATIFHVLGGLFDATKHTMFLLNKS